MARSVLLFDIDGTLIDCAGAGLRAMSRGFERTHGRADAVSHFPFGGMTDPAIVRAGLEHLNQEPTARAISTTLEAYLVSLAEEIARGALFRVIPHVVETLDRALSAGHFIGLGTGNLRRGAELKLGHAGLGDRFAFGGFACDAEKRAEVLRHGKERGHALSGPDARVVVIGDTPHDVAAAHAIGAECLAVATGRSSVADLEKAGAHLAVANLDDPRARAFLA